MDVADDVHGAFFVLYGEGLAARSPKTLLSRTAAAGRASLAPPSGTQQRAGGKAPLRCPAARHTPSVAAPPPLTGIRPGGGTAASPARSRHGFRLCLKRRASSCAVPRHALMGTSSQPLSCGLILPCRSRSSPCFSSARTSSTAPRPPRPFQAGRLCAQPAFFQPSRHLCAKKNDFVKKNANTALFPSSLPDKSACSPPESPPKTGAKNRKNQEITDFFRQSALTSPAKHVSVFSIAAGLQAVLGITCGVSVTFERVFFHVQVHLCWEPPLGRY